MNKDAKIEDIAQDVTKITEEELKGVQEKVGQINQLQMQVGGLEVQKTIGIENIKAVQGELSKLQNELEEKYGKVSVNLQDGTIKPIEEDEANTEN
tara:strand:+ start:416 stop:703 length:288 start_codon:yes stop_codon:yes gene_type:complete